MKSGPARGSSLYVVSAEAMDLRKVDFPNFLSTVDHGMGSNVVQIYSGGVCHNEGYEAIKAVYPDAVMTWDRKEAFRLAHSMPNGRIQISSNVSIETRAQADELMDKGGYSLRDVLTLGIEGLYREKVQNDKDPVYELVDDKLDMVPEDFREQELDFLADAIQIRRHQIMARKLARAGFSTRLCVDREGHSKWWFSYILVGDSAPDSPEPGVFADLEECQRLLDTARNLPAVDAFARWKEKVKPLRREKYTHNDAIRDIREERAELTRRYAAGEIDEEMYTQFWADARNYFEYVEE